MAHTQWSLTLYSGLLFKCAAGISASFFFFLLAGIAFQDDVPMVTFFLPFAFTYLLVGADLVESGPR